MSIGMWHQSGAIPNSPEETIVMQLQDVPEVTRTTTFETGSLAKLIGFNQDPIPVGGLKNGHVFKEAIVAVPFIEEDCETKFFKIHEDKSIARKMIDAAMQSPSDSSTLEFVGSSIVDMVNKMKEYVFPPAFDFLTNDGRDGTREIDPIAMYIFEFEKQLTKQDLANIWQNMPPTGLVAGKKDDINKKFEHSVSRPVTHKLHTGKELLEDVENRMRWMVFKVKQRAHKNYYNVLDKSHGQPVLTKNYQQLASAGKKTLGSYAMVKKDVKIADNKVLYKDFEPAYSYNWPYDFFSLVELAKVKAEVVINDRDKTKRLEECEDNIPEEDPIKNLAKTMTKLNKTLKSKNKNPGRLKG
jgi:hypothetical protein